MTKDDYIMKIKKVENNDKLKYKDLLLLADEQMDMVEKYLYRGEMYLLSDNDDVIGSCIVTDEGNGNCELKSLAILPAYQRNGYGKLLIAFVLQNYKEKGHTLYVGTGASPITIGFYESCGFVYSHSVKNFFIDNYQHPIFEAGVQLVDMIYLKQKL